MKKQFTFGNIYLTLFHFSFLFISISTLSQPGLLDQTFGTGGKVKISISNCNSECRAMVLQTDGKMVLAGSNYSCSNTRMALIRLNKNGSLDNSFGVGGNVIDTFPGIYVSQAHAVAVQSDGKIIVGGEAQDGTGSDLILVRYNSDGTRDNTFGNSGVVITDLGSTQESCYSLAIQPDGKIITGGHIIQNNKTDALLIRYNTQGAIDSSFGTNGISTISLGSTLWGAIFTIKIQPNGKIVVSGRETGATNNYKFLLMRFNVNGFLDSSFGANGINITSIGDINDTRDMAIQNDGKIIQAGYARFGSDGEYALVRFNNDGTIDNSFGVSGIVTSYFGLVNQGDVICSIKIQQDGKVIACGETTKTSFGDIALVRYKPNGTIDSTFGTNGQVITDILNIDHVYTAALQMDNKVVIAGSGFNGSNNITVAARYNLEPKAGIGKISYASQFYIYPSPAKSSIEISIPEINSEGILYISNALGDIVLENKINLSHSNQIDIKPFQPGFYFVKVEIG